MGREKVDSSNPVLVLGASHSELAIYQSIRNLGFEPWGLALHSIHPLVQEIAEGVVAGDYSDENVVARVVSDIGGVALIPGANDLAARSHSIVAPKLADSRSDPFDTYLEIHHKEKFRALCEKLHIPSPKWKPIEFESTNLDRAFFGPGPWLLKPTSMSGGKGITFVDRLDLEHIQIDRRLSENWIVEEFEAGSLHSVFSILSKDGLDLVFFADEELKPGTFHVKDASSPSRLDEDVREIVTSWVQRFQSHFDLRFGVLHLQFIMGRQGPVAIELARRPPGDCYLDFASYCLGLSVSEKLVSSFVLGDPSGSLPEVSLSRLEGRVTRRCRFSDLDEGSPGRNFRKVFSRAVVAGATTKVSVEIFSDIGD